MLLLVVLLFNVLQLVILFNVLHLVVLLFDVMCLVVLLFNVSCFLTVFAFHSRGRNKCNIQMSVWDCVYSLTLFSL